MPRPRPREEGPLGCVTANLREAMLSRPRYQAASGGRRGLRCAATSDRARPQRRAARPATGRGTLPGRRRRNATPGSRQCCPAPWVYYTAVLHPYAALTPEVVLDACDAAGFRALDPAESWRVAPGDKVYVFFRIFSPARFSDQVQMRWHWKDPARGWTSPRSGSRTSCGSSASWACATASPYPGTTTTRWA